MAEQRQYLTNDHVEALKEWEELRIVWEDSGLVDGPFSDFNEARQFARQMMKALPGDSSHRIEKRIVKVTASGWANCTAGDH